MDSYKKEYNKLLERYYNGCEYLKQNPNEFNNYLKLLLNILEKLNIIIVQNNITNKEIILNGFKI